MSIGDKVRATRKAVGISQEEVARRAGVSLNVINRLERGVILDPHYSTLRGIARALEVPVEDLVREPALATTLRDETTEDLKRRALEETQYAKAPDREEWVEERNADREAWLEKGRRRTLAYTTIVAINAELERRGVRSPVELAVKQYNEVMGSADSVPEAGAGAAAGGG